MVYRLNLLDLSSNSDPNTILVTRTILIKLYCVSPISYSVYQFSEPAYSIFFGDGLIRLKERLIIFFTIVSYLESLNDLLNTIDDKKDMFNPVLT